MELDGVAEQILEELGQLHTVGIDGRQRFVNHLLPWLRRGRL